MSEGTLSSGQPAPLDWHDLSFNGMPAYHRALLQLQTQVKELAAQLGLVVSRMDQLQQAALKLEERATTLEYVVSEELLCGLARPAERDGGGR